jgi:peroxiredoxin
LFCAALLVVGLVYVGIAVNRLMNPREVTVQPVPMKPVDLAEDAKARLRIAKPRALTGTLDEVLSAARAAYVPTRHHPLLGKPAPDFKLLDTDGNERSLAELRAAGPVVLIFYYGYHCDHCVSQLFDVHEDIRYFHELGVAVVAVSADPPELTRERYKEYGNFAFPVMSDPGNKVAALYGLFRPAIDDKPENLDHGTFVIARDGKVTWAAFGSEPFSGNSTLLYQAAWLENKSPKE